jgi:hypothetical protein
MYPRVLASLIVQIVAIPSQALNICCYEESLARELQSAIDPAHSPMDFIKPYKDSGFAVLVWRKPGKTEDSNPEEFVRRITEKGLKTQALPIPEPPPSYPAPPYYPELTLTILDPSTTDAILRIASDFLQQVYSGMQKITVKADIVLDRRVVSIEANGSAMEVGETIKNVPKMEKLASSNLVIIMASHELVNPASTKFCAKCGIAMPAKSEFCHNCGAKQ